ncbi:meiosis initiator protein isoform X2 [Hyperolius riggenbachi]|uniref:meiosis initiator protein isoform X2 n=1 Tax=Hyperolius riggenbachi TaxID=752182 RepID=UPI0035A2E5E9
MCGARSCCDLRYTIMTCERGAAPVRKKLVPGTEELGSVLPGGYRWQHGTQVTQDVLLRAISYIQFLQSKVQETQNKLVPHSSQLEFLPLCIPRSSITSTPRKGKAHPTSRKKHRPKACTEWLELEVEPGVRQKLVRYLSSSSSDNGDLGPWLVSVSGTPTSPRSPFTPSSLAAPIVCVSPLLRSSPLAEELDDSLTPPALFHEVQIECSSPTQESAVASRPAVECSVKLENESSAVTGGSGLLFQRQHQGFRVEIGSHMASLKSDCSTIGCVKSGAHSKAKKKAVKVPPSGNVADAEGSAAGNADEKPPLVFQLQRERKKCVNGFIMFCRLNRKAYLRANPGKASTTATRDLAELWKVMSVEERYPYCMKALQFSVLNNRMVRKSKASMPIGYISPPKPLSVLLAEKIISTTPAL